MSASARLFRIGKDRQGRWVAQDQQGLCGGLFVDRAQALKFAMFENGNRRQAVLFVPYVLDLDMGVHRAQPSQNPRSQQQSYPASRLTKVGTGSHMAEQRSKFGAVLVNMAAQSWTTLRRCIPKHSAGSAEDISAGGLLHAGPRTKVARKARFRPHAIAASQLGSWPPVGWISALPRHSASLLSPIC